MQKNIVIKGARENNLKNVNLTIPRDTLTVFTGLSGSGKSTLAFDTIYAEGQRRYVESLSSYARMFLGQMEKPEVDLIEGLSPAISIDQKTTSHNPRSTVGTVTEIYDYMRLLFARVGEPHCPKCGKKIERQTVEQICDQVLSKPNGTKVIILAPVVRGRKGEFKKDLEGYRKSGYVRVLVDGITYDLSEDINLDKNVKHSVSVIIDRLVIKDGVEKRLWDALETALKLADGLCSVSFDGEEILYSTRYACSDCGISIEELEPRLFSFNNPFGACPDCSGLGFRKKIDPDLIVKDKNKTLREGAMSVTGWNLDSAKMAQMYLSALAKRYNFSMDVPVKDLPKDIYDMILYGNGGEKIEYTYETATSKGSFKGRYEGIIPNLERRYGETTSDWTKMEIERYMVSSPCDTCHGRRLNKTALAVLIGGKNIAELTEMSIVKLIEFFDELTLDNTKTMIATPILKEIKARLNFLKDVGLNYLTLARSSSTLSGGESQRIRLATQIGSGLAGVLYILDEPSIGLHQRDNQKLINTLKHLRDLGNTLIVVEHDEDTMRSADFIVDIGRGAGVHGGEVVYAGDLKGLENCENSYTSDYLFGRRKIEVPRTRFKPSDKWLSVKGAKQNNLKNISVDIPVGLLTAVTGVSGSGKSSLVNEVILPAVSGAVSRVKYKGNNYDEISGIEYFDNVIAIDQQPIGRTPRSNPATYTGVFSAIRDLFASTPDAKERGYKSGRFSFNVAGGRCEHCSGDGVMKIEMHFLSDIYVPCEVCHGKRYNRETLQVKYKGKNIADVLDMTVDEAVEFFENVPSVYNKIKTLKDVGLGYIKLGQSSTTLSGGEAQRVKLATELSKRQTGKTLYILDEPTTGLHAYDVEKLCGILRRLRENGNTVLVIEHNLDVIKIADYIIDLGPEGGDGGGTIIAKGTPEEVSQVTESYTGQFLKNMFNKE